MCSCQNKINGMGRKKSKKMAKKKTSKRRYSRVRGLNKNDLQTTAMAAVIGGVGAHVLGMILEKVLPAEYAQYTHYAKIAGGVAVAAMSKNKMLQAGGLGAATVGAAAVVADLTDGVNGVNLLPPGRPSVYVSGTTDGVTTL
jgi:predicted phage gp36 major capsid-like protein